MAQNPNQQPRVLIVPIVAGWQDLPAGQLVGVSEDLDAIDAARELAEALGRINCMFIPGSADEIPWRDAYFDAAYIVGEATAEVRRVCTPDAEIHQCAS